MSTNGYAKIERGETKVYFPKLEQIAELFDVDLMELMSFGEKHVFAIGDGNSGSTNLIVGSTELAFENQKLQLIIQHKDAAISHREELIAHQKQEIASLREMIALLKAAKAG